MAEFIQPQAGSIKDRDGKADFGIVSSPEEAGYIFRGGDIGKIGTEGAEGELGRIPVFMQDICVKELQMGDDHVDGTVRKAAFRLDPVKIVTHDLPGSVLRQDGKAVEEGQIGFDIG